MSHVYLFSHVGLCVFPYLVNYITSLYWKLSENYKHGCRNDQPICKNKGRNESNELSSNYLRFFQNNLGLVFHTTYSCIFHSCYLLLHFPLLHFHSRIFRPCNFDRIAFSTPAFLVAPSDPWTCLVSGATVSDDPTEISSRRLASENKISQTAIRRCVLDDIFSRLIEELIELPTSVRQTHQYTIRHRYRASTASRGK